MTLVWITRTEPAATATADTVAARGFAPLVDPLLVVERLRPAIDSDAFAHLIVTSTNGLRAYCDQHTARHQTVWAVGNATAQAARDSGFATVHSASGDVTDLIALLRETRPQGPALYLRPETPARDVSDTLSTGLKGFDLTPAIFYRTVVRDAALARQAIDAIRYVLLYSPRAASASAPYLSNAALTAVCISDAAAGALRESLNLVTGNLPPAGLNIRVAATPDEGAMLDKLR